MFSLSSSSWVGVFGIAIFIWLSVCASAQQSNQPLLISATGFHSYAHKLSSGKITILNEKQIQIENIIYDGAGPAAWFAVGSIGDYKSERPTNFNNVTLIPDENGSCEIAKKYDGTKTITLTLPKELKVTDINFLVMYCVKYNHNFGYVEIPKNLDVASLPAVANDVRALDACKRPSSSSSKNGRMPTADENKGTSGSTIAIIVVVSIIALVAIIVTGVVVRRKFFTGSNLV